MATNFPTSLDSLTNPATTDQLNSPSHAAQHANANDAIEQLQAKVGVDGSTVTTSHAYKIAQLESDIQNSAGDFIPLSVLGQPSGPAELNPDGNLIVPENKIIIEGATADAHELTIQAPDVTSDITVNLPNAAGTLALTSDITTAVNNLVNSAPTTLDTLNELATALGNDANFATTTATSIGNKVSKAGGDTITSSTASTVPLVLKGAASQTANLQEWQDSAGNLLGRITSTGVTSFYGGSNIFPGDVRAGTSSYLTAALSVSARIATESGLVVRGAVSQTANLTEWQNSAGTVLANVSPAGKIAMKHINGISGDMLSLGSNGASDILVVGYDNISAVTYINGGSYGPIQVQLNSAANGKFVIKGAASQTANLQEWQNSAGTALALVDSTGQLRTNNIVALAGYSDIRINSNINALYAMGIGNITPYTGSAMLAVSTLNGSTSSIGILVRGVSGQTGNLQEWQLSSGTVAASLSAYGDLIIPGSRVAIGSASLGGNTMLHTVAATASYVPIVAKGYASQTANLQEWQNSAGTVLANIKPDGGLKAADITSNNTMGALRYYWGNVSTGVQSLSYITGSSNAGLVIETINTGSANATFDGNNILSIKGLPNQTGNLQQWQNSAGTVLSKIDSAGAMFTTTAAANTNTTQVATTAYVQTELADLVNSAPATLDTLKELSDALGADANFATTVTNNLALKAPLASPALTGTPTAPTAAVGTDSTQVATTAFVIDQIDASTQPGALYQTTAPTSPEIGQIWIDSDDNVTVFDSNIIRRQPFTATAGQTNFVTTVPFIDGFEQVYFNGLLLLKTTDYTTSGTNTVILGSAAAVNDIIEVVTITNLNSVNTYTQAETDALLAANTSVAPLSISANTNLLAKKRYFVTSASALTLTLPASPALNDEIQILDASGNASTYNITVARNGRLINGNAGNLIIDNNGGWYTLLYTGATYGWKVG